MGVFIRTIINAKSFRRTLIASVALSICCAVVFIAVPLLNVVGYESGAAAGAFISLIAFCLGCAAAGTLSRQAGDNSDDEDRAAANVFSAFFVSASAAASLVALIFCATAGYSFLIGGCNVGSGVPLFLLITIPTAIHFSAAGVFLGSFRRAWLSAIFFAIYFIAGAAQTLNEALDGQRQVLHNITIGLFSMSGASGFELTVPATFIPYRAIVAAASLFFLGLAMMRFSASDMEARGGAWLSIIVAGAIAACFFFCGDATGLDTGRKTMERALNIKYTTPHARLHFSQDTFSDKEAEIAGKFVEWNLSEIRNALWMTQRAKIEVYLYKDADQMERHTGARDFYFAQPWKNSLHISARAIDSPILKHELTHAVMGKFGRGIFGTPYNFGLIEGLATAIESNYYLGADYQESFAAALKAGVLSSAEKSIDNAGFGSSSMGISYDMAGGFIGYMIHAHGTDRIKMFYANPDAKKIYGKTLLELNNEWVEWLKTVPASELEIRKAAFIYDDSAFPPFFRQTCPRVGSRMKQSGPAADYFQYYKKGRHKEAANLCESQFNETGNPQWLVNQAVNNIEAGEYSKALKAADRALRAEKINYSTKDSAHIQKIMALAKMNKPDEAAAAIADYKAFDALNGDRLEIASRLTRTSGGRLLLPYFIRYDLPPDNVIASALKTDSMIGETRGALAIMMVGRDAMESRLPVADRHINVFVVRAKGLEPIKYDMLTRLGTAYLKNGRPWVAIRVYEKAMVFARSGKSRRDAEINVRKAMFFTKKLSGSEKIIQLDNDK